MNELLFNVILILVSIVGVIFAGMYFVKNSKKRIEKQFDKKTDKSVAIIKNIRSVNSYKPFWDLIASLNSKMQENEMTLNMNIKGYSKNE